MNKKQTVPILLGVIVVLAVALGLLWLHSAQAADAKIVTSHVSSEISGAGLRAHIAEDSSYASDSQFTQTDAELLASLRDEQVLYKETVTRDYGGQFSIIFTAYFTDAERTQCVLAHVQPLAVRVSPSLENVDFVVTPTSDAWAMFCRYTVHGIVETSDNRRILSTLGTVEKETMFRFSGNTFYGSDVILYQQLYSTQ